MVIKGNGKKKTIVVEWQQEALNDGAVLAAAAVVKSGVREGLRKGM